MVDVVHEAVEQGATVFDFAAVYGPLREQTGEKS